MEDDHFEYLNRIYRKLYEKYKLQFKEIIEGSLFISLTLQEKMSNKRFKLLWDASFEEYKIPKITRESLLQNGYIRSTGTDNRYYITARGIWKVEEHEGKINADKLIKFIDKEKFSKSFQEVNKNITDKQKVILFTLIATRCFSQYSVADLKTQNRIKDVWAEVVDECYSFLEKMGTVKKLKYSDLYGRVGNEHKVSNLFRHTDRLPKLTQNIFQTLGRSQKYYLDLSNNKQINKGKLKILLQKIFDSITLDSNKREKISNFCREISHGYDTRLFPKNKNDFHGFEYDGEIEDLILFNL